MTLVALQKLTASDRLGRRGAARGRIVSAELFLVAGIHVVLGQPEDGTLALVEAPYAAVTVWLGQEFLQRRLAPLLAVLAAGALVGAVALHLLRRHLDRAHPR